MPPPSDHPSLHVFVAEPLYFVTKLSPDNAIPPVFLEALGVNSGRFLSITRTPDEISVVGEVQGDFPVPEDDMNWKAFRLRGPFPFDLTGILNSFIAPLKDAGIGIFAISTFNTDFILIAVEQAQSAVEVLSRDGWVVKMSR
ncbi:hypothetical protein FIBSPDRAFT_950322 [Athelia psychrophila]|uniref:CASTOR ACT domain-containing protein n=1 Tax=Athelia psychrophila TaxID=1759441 RepID=A0A166NR20_9AGAM|nr:hypothetical protein FIBSPDRAFT_950322 [Fibularhizoctonia sp. CBS 109695]